MKYLLLTTLIFQVSLITFGQTTNVNYYDQYGNPVGKAVITQGEQSLTLPKYQSTVPVELMMQVSMQKQEMYDKRHKWIQEEIENIANTINHYLIAKYPIQGEVFGLRYKELVRNLNINSNDLSLNSVFNPIASQLKAFEREVHDEYYSLESATRAKIEKMINVYNSYTSYPAVSDGWHAVYFTDGNSMVCKTECNVEKGTITDLRTCEDYRRSPDAIEGSAIQTYDVVNSPQVRDCRSAISVAYKAGIKKYTVYFIDDSR